MRIELEITTVGNNVNITGTIIDRGGLSSEDIKGILNGALSEATGIKNSAGKTVPSNNRNITINADETFFGFLNR